MNIPIADPLNEKLLDRIFKNPPAIRKIKNPSHEFLMRAIEKNPRTIEYIKPEDMAISLQLAIINRNEHWFQYIKNPSVDAQFLAVSKLGKNIKHINKPSILIQMTALNETPSSFYDSPEKFDKFILNEGKSLILSHLLRHHDHDNKYIIFYMEDLAKKGIEWSELIAIQDSLKADGHEFDF